MDDEILICNGIDGSSGDYLLPPIKVTELSNWVQDENLTGREPLSVLRIRKERDTEPHLGMVELVEAAQDLGQAGWNVILPSVLSEQELNDLKIALKPLLNCRKQQAGDRYKEYSGANGYREGDTILDGLPRHGRSPAETADPQVIPYYLLIVGDPGMIPYTFQYHLDITYAVGRLFFDSLGSHTSDQALTKGARRNKLTS